MIGLLMWHCFRSFTWLCVLQKLQTVRRVNLIFSCGMYGAVSWLKLCFRRRQSPGEFECSASSKTDITHFVCVGLHRCPSWSDDEQLCVRSVNNELHFYENNDYSKNNLIWATWGRINYQINPFRTRVKFTVLITKGSYNPFSLHSDQKKWGIF